MTSWVVVSIIVEGSVDASVVPPVLPVFRETAGVGVDNGMVVHWGVVPTFCATLTFATLGLTDEVAMDLDWTVPVVVLSVRFWGFATEDDGGVGFGLSAPAFGWRNQEKLSTSSWGRFQNCASVGTATSRAIRGKRAADRIVNASLNQGVDSRPKSKYLRRQ